MKALVLLAMALCAGALPSQPEQGSRAQIRAEIEQLRAELTRKEAQYLEPSAADLGEIPELANRTDAGVIRLLPRETFNDRTNMTVPGGGAYYSFKRLTHEYGYGSDIELFNGELSVGFAGADYGYLVRVPEATVLSATLESPEVAALAKLETPSDLPGARREQRRASDGFKVGDTRYRNRVKAEVGATYALRSVNYEGSDVLVAFQVLRKDDDGSLILAWSLLKEFPKPHLTRVQETPGS